MAPDRALNPDYERRPYWQATMPALPDRSGRDLPDAADVVVIGGGYAGINAARELARAGRRGHAARGADAGLGRLDPERRDRPRGLQVERRPS